MKSLESRVRQMARIVRYRGYPIPFLARRYIRRAGERYAGFVVKHEVCLDIGAGVAPYRVDIIEGFRVGHYVAYDIAPSDATTVVGDARKLPFRDESVSLIVSMDTLQHIPAVADVFDEMERVLKHGGLLLVSFPFVFGECDVTDFRRWSLEGMADELRQRGFEILHAERRGGVLFAATCVLHWAVQHVIPGARKAWRVRLSGLVLLRSIVVTALTIPTALLCWLALAVDGLLPACGFYMGGLMVARRKIEAANECDGAS
ncbi:class I SAM-dependent methyltransferase [Burkholderia mayonis]|nr:class I SAM-dependent methyltransferase [Burkholderia mayonis]